jgi:hypothetical protein
MATSNHGLSALPESLAVDFLSTGRDEMNLAEFPLAVLTDRTPRATKTLEFKNQHGTLTITGSDKYGLPTALDADVMVALIQLTKQKTDFEDSVVNFTRYELLRLLQWPNEGKSYRRLAESLKCWHGVSLVYDGCWWDNQSKQYGDANIHIIESVVILDGNSKFDQNPLQPSLPLSSFEWNRKFIESCQANNLKYLDTKFYFSLAHPSSKQLFRFLDKRFYHRSEWVFDLTEIAFERVGLSRNYADAGKIKEKLQSAIEELESREFLRPMSRSERYFKEGKVWKIRFAKQLPALAFAPEKVLSEPEPSPLPLTSELAKRGVSDKTAAELVAAYSAEAIEAKLEVFDWLVGKQDKRIGKSPEGYLVKSIRDDYKAPKGFVSAAQRRQEEEARNAREQQAADDRRRKREEEAREQAEKKAVAAYWEGLSPAEQDKLQADADALADPETLAQEHGPLKRMGQQLRRREYIRQLLRDRQAGEA